jgi:hypothetical protein
MQITRAMSASFLGLAAVLHKANTAKRGQRGYYEEADDGNDNYNGQKLVNG